MKFYKRIAAALVAACCILSLTACGGSGTRLVFTTGFDKDEVFRIGEASCTRAELMVCLINTQNQYESVYGEEVWELTHDGVTLEQNVKDTVLAKMAQLKTMYLLAEEKGVSLTEEEEAKVKAAGEEYFASLNETELAKLGVTSEIIENMYREYALASKVYREIIRDINPEISDDEARTITVQHIFLSTVRPDRDGNAVSVSEAEKHALYQKMQEIRAEAMENENKFADLAARYSEDENITYSFGKGDMEEAFETAAFQLETGEISGIVESAGGYHLIKCLSTFDREETDANKLEIVEQRRKEVFGQEYDRFVETLVRNLNTKLWDEITLLHDSNIKTADFFDICMKYFPE